RERSCWISARTASTPASACAVTPASLGGEALSLPGGSVPSRTGPCLGEPASARPRGARPCGASACPSRAAAAVIPKRAAASTLMPPAYSRSGNEARAGNPIERFEPVGRNAAMAQLIERLLRQRHVGHQRRQLAVEQRVRQPLAQGRGEPIGGANAGGPPARVEGYFVEMDELRQQRRSRPLAE